MQSFEKLLSLLLSEIVNPVVYFLSACCFTFFIFNVVKFIKAKQFANQEGIEKGKRNMLYGLIGLIVIYSASSIYKFIVALF